MCFSFLATRITTQLKMEELNRCPICFSLSPLASLLNFIGMTQQMSDMLLQLVIGVRRV
jgi:hypothetical protein